MEWGQLSERQQKFLTEYIGNGYDQTKATLAAYNCTNDTSARVLSYKVLYSVPVAMLVAIHFGDEPQEAFCKVLYRRLCRGRISPAEADMFKLYAEVRGYRRAWVAAYPDLTNRAIQAQKEKGIRHELKRQAEEKQEPKPEGGGLLEEFN